MAQAGDVRDQEPKKRHIQKPISKKRKFVKDGVFYAELNDFLAKELAEDGYAGCEVRVTPTRTEVIIRATRPRQVVGEQGRRVREITALVQKRFQFQKGQIILFAEKIRNKGLSALSQAQAVKFRLMQGLSVRRAAYSVVKFIMDKGAKGCEVVVTGKLRGQRAKKMKFKDGLMLCSGDIVNYYVEKAVKHVHLRQGVIGIKVKIMLPHDPTGNEGIQKDLPDSVKIEDPDKEDPLAMMDQVRYGGMAKPEYMTDVRTLEAGGMGMQSDPAPQPDPEPMDDPMAQQPDDQMAPPQDDMYAQQPPMQQQQPPPQGPQYGQPPPQQYQPQQGYNQY